MLIYTGTRLASPHELIKTFRAGRGEFLVFVATAVVTVASDLLVGVAAGVALAMAVRVVAGARRT